MDEVVRILSGLPYGGISFASLVTLTIILIIRGEIVPRATVDGMRADRDAIIKAVKEENLMLKEAYVMSEKARVTSADSQKEILELSKTAVHLLTSIQERAKEVNG